MSDLSHWLLVIGDADALETVLETGVMGLRDSVREQPGDGDQLIVYTTRGAYGNPTKDESQILAAGQFTSGVLKDPVIIAGEEYPKRIRLTIDHRLPLRDGVAFRQYIPDMAFIKNKQHWAPYVHKTLAELSPADHAILYDAIVSSKRSA